MSAFQDVRRFADDGSPSVDHSGTIISGPRVVAERVAARWMRSPSAAFWAQAPEDAVGLGQYLNHDFGPGETDRLRARLIRAAHAEDGVGGASVTLTLLDDGLAVYAEIQTSEGAVELNVNAAGAVSIFAPTTTGA